MKLERTDRRTFRADLDPQALLLVDLILIGGRRRWQVTVETYDPAPAGLDLAETQPTGDAPGPVFRSIADLQAWARDPDADQWAAETLAALRR